MTVAPRRKSEILWRVLAFISRGRWGWVQCWKLPGFELVLMDGGAPDKADSRCLTTLVWILSFYIK
eukprot:175592-Amorphochlora_amoeboformis.AAC.1